MEFIPLAEASGLIVPIGRWVLREATLQAATWQETDPQGIHISVNVSVRQFRHPELLRDVADALHRAGLPAHLLTLEITESLFASDDGDVTHKLERLKDLGVRLALDDFGTGYSSLSYLRRFPVDSIKMAKPFVEVAGPRPGDHASDARPRRSDTNKNFLGQRGSGGWARPSLLSP